MDHTHITQLLCFVSLFTEQTNTASKIYLELPSLQSGVLLFITVLSK